MLSQYLDDMGSLLYLGERVTELLSGIESLNPVSMLIIQEGKGVFFYNYILGKTLLVLANHIADGLNEKFKGNDFKYSKGDFIEDKQYIFDIIGKTHQLSFKLVPVMKKRIQDSHETIYFTCAAIVDSGNKSIIADTDENQCSCCCS
jgi:hypothetical protein